MRKFDTTKWRVFRAGLALLALVIAAGAPGQYTTSGYNRAYLCERGRGA